MAINVLIQTLLSAPRQPLDLYRSALASLSPALGDGKVKVRQAALEAVAVLNEAAGASAFVRLLAEARQLEPNRRPASAGIKPEARLSWNQTGGPPQLESNWRPASAGFKTRGRLNCGLASPTAAR